MDAARRKPSLVTSDNPSVTYGSHDVMYAEGMPQAQFQEESEYNVQ